VRVAWGPEGEELDPYELDLRERPDLAIVVDDAPPPPKAPKSAKKSVTLHRFKQHQLKQRPEREDRA
jgi:hypothetical protein